MEIKHSTKNLLGHPLPDLLEKFYSAAALRQFADLYLYPLFPELDIMEKPRKADLISALMSLEADRNKLEALVKSFEPELFRTIEMLLWTNWVNLEELESVLDSEISRPHPDFPNLRYRDCPYELLPGFELIALGEVDEYYSWASRQPQKSRFRVRLPSAMRRLLKPGFPHPKHYEWEPVDFKKAVAADAFRYSAESDIASDLAFIGDYLQRGNLKLTKSGKISAASLRSVMELTSGSEFFPESTASKKLPRLRHELLIQSVLKFDDKLVGLLGKEPFPADKIFKELIPNLLLNKDVLLEQVLQHIKPSGYLSGTVSTDALRGLRQVFASLPAGEWVTAGNLVHYPHYREMNLLFLDPYYFRFRDNGASPGRRQGRYYGSTVDLVDDNVMEIVQYPLLLGSAFLLAAFGLLEIAYIPPPEHPRWRMSGEDFLSPFDGLAALRLTSLGAYAFGQTSKLTVALPEKRAVRVHLHPERLIASCREADPLTVNALEEFMERLAPGLYRLTPEKLLAGCHSKGDLRERIEAFRQRIPADVPELWEENFRGYLQTVEPLTCEEAFVVYRIADSPDLRQLFASDPILSKLGIKVEGWRIAVTPDELKRLRERLRSLGYLLEADSPAAGRGAAKKKVPRRKSRRRYY